MSGGVQVFSGFAGALRDARRVTGRDPATGAVVEPALCGSWLGVLGYLILLDQIGHSLGLAGSKTRRGDLRVALHEFSKLPAPEVAALYALRCALAHDYSLLNKNYKRPELNHNFTLSSSHTSPLVSLPATPWDGDLDHRAGARTTVNLWGVGDLVESVVQRIFDAAIAGDLVVTLEGGSDELLQRYSLVVQPGPTLEWP
jgi:hypothetical protein